jgi:hypothetical protein
MNIEKRSAIYDRLLAIEIKLDAVNIPDPKAINQKIGECHAYIQEVEHYSIEVSREVSVLEQALNNSTAEYEAKKEELLSKSEEIKNLPSIRDREAKANQHLKEEMSRVKTYKNELSAMAHIEKALYLKMKNLDRVNKDIKSQLRAMEAQMRIMGSAPGGAVDSATKSLMDEFKKSIAGTDCFGESTSSMSDDQIMDPTEPLDVAGLLSASKSDFVLDESISEKTLDPTPDISPSASADSVILEPDGLVFDAEDEPTVIDEKTVKEVEDKLKASTQASLETVIDLNDIIDFKQEKGGKETTKKVVEPEKKAEIKQKEVRKDQKIGIDIDDLLDSLQP